MSLKLGLCCEHVAADRVHQVRLAQAHAAVDEQRVVGPRRRFRDRAAGRVRELVRRPDDERVEGVAGVEARRLPVIGAGSDVDRRPGSTLVQIRRRRRPVRRRRLRRASSPSVTNDRPASGAAELGQRLVDDRGVVLGQPVPEQRVRAPGRWMRRALVGHEGGRLEPGVVAVPVDLGLDPAEDLVPDVCHRIERRHAGEASALDFRPEKRPEFTGSLPIRHSRRRRGQGRNPFRHGEIPSQTALAAIGLVKARGFPQFFPQVWKTLGGNPNGRGQLCSDAREADRRIYHTRPRQPTQMRPRSSLTQLTACTAGSLPFVVRSACRTPAGTQLVSEDCRSNEAHVSAQ